MIEVRPAPAAIDPATRRGFLDLVEERFGLRLTEHQARNLDRSVAEILARSGLSHPAVLLAEFVRGQYAQLLEDLAATFSIGETHFFRVGPQIEALRQVILPSIVAARESRRQLRIWSAGCSTGEEPYTVAILLRSTLPDIDSWNVEILGTDLCRRSLEAARAGVYREWSFRDTPDHIRARFFVPEDHRYRLVEPVRRMVRFERMNLAAESWPWVAPQPDRFDLILCRNVTIYFSPAASRKLNQRLGQHLARDGWLVLGPSDPTPEPGAGLAPVNLPGAVVWRTREAVLEQDGERSDSAALPAKPLATAGEIHASVPNSEPTRGGLPPLRCPRRQPPADPRRAKALAQRGDRVTARLEAERWVRAWPLDPEAHLLLGMLSLDEGLVESAIRSLRRAALLDEGNGLVHFNLGNAYLRLGDHTRARAALFHARRALLEDHANHLGGPGTGISASDLMQAVEEQLAALG